MTNQLFEMSYNECNPIAENAYLESPLDTELKPPMLMEDIYFECNLKLLFEQVLREVNVTSNYLSQLIQNAFVSSWKISINEEFAKQVANDVINEVTKDGTLNLMKIGYKKLK